MNNNNISHNVTQLSSNGRMIDDPKCIANKLNNFFVDVGPTTEITIPKIPPDKISPKSYMKARNNFVFIIAHISTEEILEIMNHLETKSSGPASIPIKLLKIIPDLIIIPLTQIIYTSFSTGKYPNKLKIVKVIPIHKGDSKTDVNNYRPISLFQFLENNNIYNDQYGFRKNSSTTRALLKITEQIRESIENKKYGCGVFIDLKKAFNTVNHEILIQKLEHYGIRNNPVKWFHSYLNNRKKYDYVNGQSSELMDIKSRVPQGSVLRPLLFLIYINDVTKYIQ